MNARGGHSVLELVVALVLAGFIAQLALTTLGRLDDFRVRAQRRADAIEAARIVRSVLRGELEYGVPGRDWQLVDDSLRLRAFRGTGLVCAADAASPSLLVAYRGERAPTPAKDSVEVTAFDGSVAALDLVGTSSADDACPIAESGDAVLRWVVSGVVPAGVVAVRVFERGSYHLAGSAFRYRVGAGGRQPLTEEVWDDASTGWSASDSMLWLTLWPEGGTGAPWGGFLTRSDGR